MRRPMRAVLYGTLGMAILLGAGCTEIGRVGDSPGDPRTIVGGGSREEIVGEVRYLDARARQIEVRTKGDRIRLVNYSPSTRVIYRGKEYSVERLERGDVVAISAWRDGYGDFHGEEIVIQEAAQEPTRDRYASRRGSLDRLEGTVERINPARGIFELRDRASGDRVVVSLPYNPRRSDDDRFRRLRVGDAVRIEGRFLNRDRFELDAFL